MSITWHRRFIQIAQQVSTWSKDPSTKVGCVIVDPHTQAILSTGFNGFPRGVQERDTELDVKHPREVITLNDLHPVRWQRPEKYKWVEHAERNAVFNAARNGIAINGCWAYMNFAPCPCTDCARALIQSGIIKIVGPDRPFTGKGKGVHYDVDDITPILLREGGVETLTVD